VRLNMDSPGPRTAVAAIALAGVGSVIVACGGSSPANETGVIAGQTPTCYGPGLNDNLEPVITIRAVRADGLARTIQVHTSNGHNGYRMTVPPGTYTVSTYSGHVAADVRANQTTTHVDLPQPGCL
jgi:hypothetical protein